METRERSRRFLVVSTSLGAGHDGNATELIRRLRARGHHAVKIDQLDLLPLRIGQAVRGWYRLQLRFIPWSYDRSWRSMNRSRRVWAALNGLLCWRRLYRILAVVEPDTIITNNPLGAQMTGYLRARRRLNVPVVTFVTDFGVHELWVHPHVDQHLCVHAVAADEVVRLGGRSAVVTGPLVGPEFSNAPLRKEARTSLASRCDLQAGRPVVVLTGGSWGVGQIQRTARLLATSCGVQLIVPCGRDHSLRNRLTGHEAIFPLGWTDDMATVFAAADVVVENAGGLSAMEAMAVGRPVITFRPLPGHGRQNADFMERAGVTTYARTESDLKTAIVRSVNGARDHGSERSAGLCDAVDAVVKMAESFACFPPSTIIAVPPRSRRRWAAISCTAGLYALSTGGVNAAIAAGIPLAPRLTPGRHQIFVGVRMNSVQLSNAGIRAELERLSLTPIIEAGTAAGNTAALTELNAAGIEPAADEVPDLASMLRARSVQSQASPMGNKALSWRPVAFVPTGGVDAIDVAWAHRSRTPVLASRLLRASDDVDRPLPSGRLYVVDERRATPEVMIADLRRIEVHLRRRGADIAIMRHSSHLLAAPLNATR